MGMRVGLATGGVVASVTPTCNELLWIDIYLFLHEVFTFCVIMLSCVSIFFWWYQHDTLLPTWCSHALASLRASSSGSAADAAALIAVSEGDERESANAALYRELIATHVRREGERSPRAQMVLLRLRKLLESCGRGEEPHGVVRILRPTPPVAASAAALSASRQQVAAATSPDAPSVLRLTGEVAEAQDNCLGVYHLEAGRVGTSL